MNERIVCVRFVRIRNHPYPPFGVKWNVFYFFFFGIAEYALGDGIERIGADGQTRGTC